MKPIFRTIARPTEARDNPMEWMFEVDGGRRVAAGVSVTQDTAMLLPVVYRCVALNSETIGALPVDALIKKGTSAVEIKKPPWLLKPNPFDTWQEFISQVQMSLEQDGNAFILKITARSGALIGLVVLAPKMVEVRWAVIAGVRSKVYVLEQNEGGPRTLGENEVLHIRGLSKPGEARGLSPLNLLREAIGVGLAAQEFGGRWFGDGANLSGVIELPGNMRAEDAERLQDQFRRKHGGIRKSHAIGVLTGGAKFTRMSVNAEESQFLHTGSVKAAEISLAFGIPPNYTTFTEGVTGYVTGVIAGKLMWLQLGLLTRITRLETALSSLMPRGYLKFNMRGFLRGSPEEETAYLSAQAAHGVISPNEWRALIDINPRDGGDVYYMPLNMGAVGGKDMPVPVPIGSDEPPDDETGTARAALALLRAEKVEIIRRRRADDVAHGRDAEATRAFAEMVLAPLADACRMMGAELDVAAVIEEALNET